MNFLQTVLLALLANPLGNACLPSKRAFAF